MGVLFTDVDDYYIGGKQVIEIQQQTTPDWLSEPVERSDPSVDLMMVIWAQTGESNGWWDCFCLEEESHHEVSRGPRETLTQFAERLTKEGWSVESKERFTAVCLGCQNPVDTATYSSQFEDNRGLLG